MRPAQPSAPAVVGTLALAMFVLLTVLVERGQTQHVDILVRDLLRDPDWTGAQARADILVEGLQPRVVLALALLAGAGASLLRRSWSPVLTSGSVVLALAVATLVVKYAVARPDPGGQLSTPGGSFPSGHVSGVVVGVGSVSLALASRTAWWEWALIALLGTAMAYALMVVSAHWLSDTAGGFLLGVGVVALAHAVLGRSRSASGHCRRGAA